MRHPQQNAQALHEGAAGRGGYLTAAFANPPRTAVTQPKCEMGVVAATMLLDRIRDAQAPAQRRVLESSMVTRKSTAPASKG